MQTRLLPDRIAGILFLISAVLFAGVWYTFLFVATPDCISIAESAMSDLRYIFSIENDSLALFVWLAASPVICAILSGLYLVGVARNRVRAKFLFLITVLLTATTLCMINYHLALVVALPGIWGYRAIHAA